MNYGFEKYTYTRNDLLNKNRNKMDGNLSILIKNLKKKE